MNFPPHLIVGFAGRAGSGKSSVARMVRERFVLPRQSVRCEVRKFAGPIREMLRVVGIEKGDAAGELGHPAYRDAAQAIGQWFRGEVSSDFWVRIQRDAIHALNAPSILLFDDVRYPNEVELCDLVVGLRTTRDNGLSLPQMLHASERCELATDLCFENDTPADAARIADAVAAKIKEMLR